jgi:hypothetical protein
MGCSLGNIMQYELKFVAKGQNMVNQTYPGCNPHIAKYRV